jgi:hypothetical protein
MRLYNFSTIVFVGVVVLSAGTFITAANITHAAGAFQHPGGFHTASQLSDARNKILAGTQPHASAWKNLISLANASLSRAPQSISVICYDGVQGGPLTDRVFVDSTNAYTLALAYYLDANLNSSTRNQYGQQVVNILNTYAYNMTKWTCVGANPPSVLSFDSTVHIATTATLFLRAAELMTQSSLWSNADRVQFKQWIETEIYPDCMSMTGSLNNWADWGIFCGVLADHLFDNQTRMARDVEILKDIIADQTNSDGTVLETFEDGVNSLYYTAYGLGARTAAIDLVRNDGFENLYNYKRAGRGSVLDTLNFIWQNAVINPSSWPVLSNQQTTVADPTSQFGQIFLAMKEVYGIQAWKDWAANVIFDHTSSHHWTFTTLLRPTSINVVNPPSSSTWKPSLNVE